MKLVLILCSSLVAIIHIIQPCQGAATGSISFNSGSLSSPSSHHRHHRSAHDGNRRNAFNFDSSSSAYQSDGTPPRLEILPGSEMKAEIGKSFVLNCLGRGGDAKLFTDLKWFNPKGDEIFPSREISVTSTNNAEKKILAFMRPTLNDAGTYTCRGNFQNTNALEAKVEVTIYGKFSMKYTYGFSSLCMAILSIDFLPRVNWKSSRKLFQRMIMQHDIIDPPWISGRKWRKSLHAFPARLRLTHLILLIFPKNESGGNI